MEKKDKVIVAGLLLVLLFIVVNIFSTLHTMDDYEQRKESGNERWKQVENRILQTEEKIENLEKEIEQWKNSSNFLVGLYRKQKKISRKSRNNKRHFKCRKRYRYNNSKLSKRNATAKS